MGRSPCCDKTKVKRGPWSPEEDNTLKNYVEKHGTGGSWIALPHKAGLKRCGKSCRLRWLNYLRPNIKHGGFTEEEDSIILRLYHNIGSRWSVIASQLPGRTDNDVKNYWNTKLKKKLFPATPYTGAASSTAGNFTISSTKNPNLGLETRRSKFDNMLPYFPMEVNSHHQELLAAEIPLPGLMEVTENYVKNAYNCGLLPSASLSEEAVPSLSPSISLDNNANGSSATWSAHGTGAEDDTFLANLGSDQLMPYDLLMNTFDFQEKFTDQIDHLNFGYSLLANISNTEQQQQPIFQSLTY